MIKLRVPSKEKLKNDYDKLRTMRAIAEKYGVSDMTVHNWFKERGVITIEQQLKTVGK